MNNDIEVRTTKYSDRKYWLMYYIDPVTEKRVSKSTKRTTQRDAERVAAEWERELRTGCHTVDARMTWADFRIRVEREKLPGLAVQTRRAYSLAMDSIEKHINSKRLVSLTAATLSTYQHRLRSTGVREATIANRLRHIKALLRWAESLNFIGKAPKIVMPKRARGKGMRGRPITTEEFDRMIDAVPKIRKKDAMKWKHYLRGLWLSGLRLAESLAVSWDPDAAFSIDLSGRHPRFRIWAEAQKSNKDELLPMAPDFAEFLLATPKNEREGYVFDMTTRRSLGNADVARVGRIISKIGQEAVVVVEKNNQGATIKYGSAHDLRRAFGTRWASCVSAATLKTLMRHASIETTMAYYVGMTADSVADELWKLHRIKINTSINTGRFEGETRRTVESDQLT